MPKYLLQVNYTLDGLKGVVAKGGTARKAAASAAAKSVGGKVDAFYFAFGDTDVYVVADMPDNEAAAALALTVSAAGGAAVKTTVLLTTDEVDSVLHGLLLLLAGITIGGVLLAAVLGGLVSRASLRPVRRFTEEDIPRVADVFDKRVEVRGGLQRPD